MTKPEDINDDAFEDVEKEHKRKLKRRLFLYVPIAVAAQAGLFAALSLLYPWEDENTVTVREYIQLSIGCVAFTAVALVSAVWLRWKLGN